MSAIEAWTVGKLLTWTTEYLKKSGSSSPRLDAEILLAQARSCQRIELYTAFNDEPAEEERAAFREMVRRRAEGTPVAYLVGYKEFYAESFEVNPDVLIPRPETEHLVVEALDRAAEVMRQRSATCGQQTQPRAAEPTTADDHSTPLRIADVGTGSGAVAICLAKHLKHGQVTATDTSAPALEVAKRNALRLKVNDRVSFVQSDLLSGCPQEQQFDLIVSNPPYVSEAEYAQLDKTVRDYEPRTALVAGPQGFEIIARLLQEAHLRLVDDGFVLVEFSPMLAERMDEFVGQQWQSLQVSKDLAGHKRIVTLRKQ